MTAPNQQTQQTQQPQSSPSELTTLEAIEQRRAVKHYDPDHVMPAADEQKLLAAAIKSPTSFNIQNWRFVNVKDKELRAKIRDVAWDQAQVTDASMLLLLCADLTAWDQNPARYWKNAPAEVQEILVSAIQPFYKDQPELQRDEAMRSVGIASQTLMLAAKSMGYDSCPMIGFDPARVGDLIKLPSDHVIGMMLVIGKALTPANPRGGQLPLPDVLVEDTF